MKPQMKLPMPLQRAAVLFLTFTSVIGVTCALSSPAYAHQRFSNPLIRTCTIHSGLFSVQPDGQDEIALCRWNSAIIDSQSLVLKLEGSVSTAAAFIQGDQISDNCTDLGAINWLIDSGEVLCVFKDRSRLALAVIRSAPDTHDRRGLKTVLSEL